MSAHEQHAQHGSVKEHHDRQRHENHYGCLLGMTGLSFIAMYILRYAMVDRIANVYPSFNQFYMAGLMTAAMIVIELGVMGGISRRSTR